MLDPASFWISEFANLPITDSNDWPDNIADLIDSLTTNKLEISGISPPSTFTFNRNVFKAGIVSLVPNANVVPNANAFALAFANAVAASTMFVAAGSSVGAPTPATTFSAPPVVVILPPTIAAAQAALTSSIIAAVPVADPTMSTVPVAFRDAFLALAASVTGLNSVVPTPGPLVVPSAPLI